MNRCCAEPSIYSVGQISIGFLGAQRCRHVKQVFLDGRSACVRGGLTFGAAFGVYFWLEQSICANALPLVHFVGPAGN